MTFYGYAERKVAEQVDWSVVGRQMSTAIDLQEEKSRQKREAIESASSEMLNVLSNVPQGEHRGVNQYALEYGSDGTEMMLMLNREFKAGRISSRDYIAKRQALMDGTREMFELMNEYQEEYARKMDLYNKGEIGEKTVYEMTLLEGLSNFADTKPYIDPNTFGVTIGKRVFNEETGVYELSKNPQDFQSIQALKNRLKTAEPKYDVLGNLNKGVAVMGKQLEVIRAGKVLTLNDVMNKKEYKDAEEAFLNSMLVNPDNVASILTDYLKSNPETGEVYSFTLDPEEAKSDNSKILLQSKDSSGKLVSQISDAQMKQAREALRNQFRTMLDHEETPMPVFQPRAQTQPRTQQQSQIPEEFYRNVGVLYHGRGGQGAVEAALEFFKTMPATARGRVHNIERTPQAVTVTFADPSTGEISQDRVSVSIVDSQGNPLTHEAFIQNMTNLIYGTRDINEAVRRDQSHIPGAPADQTTEATATVRRTVKPFGEYTDPSTGRTPKAEFGSRTDTYSRYVSSGNVEKEARNVRDALNKFPNSQLVEGMTVKPQTDGIFSAPSSRDITVTLPSIGQTFTISIGKDNVDERIAQLEEIWNVLSQASQGQQASPRQQTQTTQPTPPNYSQF